jgi:hypothetical protein
MSAPTIIYSLPSAEFLSRFVSKGVGPHVPGRDKPEGESSPANQVPGFVRVPATKQSAEVHP